MPAARRPSAAHWVPSQARADVFRLPVYRHCGLFDWPCSVGMFRHLATKMATASPPRTRHAPNSGRAAPARTAPGLLHRDATSRGPWRTADAPRRPGQRRACSIGTPPLAALGGQRTRRAGPDSAGPAPSGRHLSRPADARKRFAPARLPPGLRQRGRPPAPALVVSVAGGGMRRGTAFCAPEPTPGTRFRRRGFLSCPSVTFLPTIRRHSCNSATGRRGPH